MKGFAALSYEAYKGIDPASIVPSSYTDGEKLQFFLTFAWLHPLAKFYTIPRDMGLRDDKGNIIYTVYPHRVPFIEEKRVMQSCKAWREIQRFPLNHILHGHLAKHSLANKWYRKGVISQPNVSNKYEKIMRNGKWELSDYGKYCSGYTTFKSYPKAA